MPRRTRHAVVLLTLSAGLLSACGDSSPQVSSAQPSAPSSSSSSSSSSTAAETPSSTSSSSSSAAPTTTSTSSSPSSAAPSTSVAPAQGARITGTKRDYSFSAPKGWSDAKGKVPNADAVAINFLDRDGFADNINVIRQEGTGGTTLDLVELASKRQLEAAGAKNVKVLPRTTVAGTEASRTSSALTSGTQSYLIDQAYILRGKNSYVVTFSFSPSVSEADRNKVIAPVLASWKWSA
ncbi:hypothetical protein [Luteipulveratus flavus]|uniref:PsbP C-terminal domain-containing protein n=1 Tax=Luteipulveratus flavus TaxID=3031728 RepID=A0ABT6C4B2_9MICO|nr:hypothetical protein [Luteipulveratus sp. YIM 133296]MDF8263791.1 hypothetical protein [Luteipulveratus sp. YIM 133296]